MEDQKIIINIGRQIGSGGRLIAKKLSEELNFSFYDRELLNLAAHESGFSEKFFEQADEHKGFFKSLLNIHIPLIGESNFYKNDLSQESLYKFQSDAILKAAKKGNCIFVGRTADYILRDFKNTINIFVTADIDERISRVSDRHNFKREEARKYIIAKEEARASYYNYYTGKQWGHSESYDLCINSSMLGIENTEAFIAELIKKRFKL